MQVVLVTGIATVQWVNMGRGAIFSRFTILQIKSRMLRPHPLVEAHVVQ